MNNKPIIIEVKDLVMKYGDLTAAISFLKVSSPDR